MDLLAWSETVAMFAVAVVLMVAGTQKLRDLAEFRRVLDSYAWLPRSARGLVGVLLPVFEVALGLVLLSGFQSEASLGLAALTLTVLTVAFLLTFGPQEASDCGCFGSGMDTSRSKMAIRNASLVLLALLALVAGRVDGIEGSGTVLLIAVVASLVAVASTLVSIPKPTAVVSDVADTDRRRFLQTTAGALTGVSLAAVLGFGRRAPVAEAACHGCGTCGTDYIFLYCVGTCCAGYIVKKFNDCDTYCFSCSTSSRVFCGVLECC